MARLLISIVVACCFVVPVVALAGNTAPKLYLELWQFAEMPDPMVGYVCVHSTKPVGGIHCYDTKVAYNSAVVPIHIGNLNQPVCPTTGPSCAGQGGFLGLGFGLLASGEAVNFMSWVACPGFLKGPSQAGEPAACIASSTQNCHDWWDHLGYLTYLNLSTRTGMTNLTIVNSADLNRYSVINCHNEYDAGTEIGGSAQWGGVQSVTCSSTPIQDTTWGSIKSLFR